MNLFYNAIMDLDKNQDAATATVVEGRNIGEKIIISKGKLIFTSNENGFLKSNLKRIQCWDKCGIYELDNQRVFYEKLGTEKKIIICGGGHVSIPIITMSLMLGFQVTVLEDRPLYANNARRAGANTVICENFEKALKDIDGDKDSFFVIVTRGHRYDQVCLEAISKKQHAYIGMIGSKVRVKNVKEALREKGVDKALLDGVHSPIGLKILAETPEEIAVSIMAEIILVKNSMNDRNAGYTKEILNAIKDEERKNELKVLATIVSRKGSAPREIGTKMLICNDGSIKGTIGGGCVESDIHRKGMVLMNEESVELHKVDMTNIEAEAEGMVCGGVIEVFLEPVKYL